MAVIFGGIVLGLSLISFGAGGLVATVLSDRDHERELQRAVRPAHIIVLQRTTKVQEFTVQPGAMDLNFPNTEACL